MRALRSWINAWTADTPQVGPRVAIVTCVRDEAALLPAFLLYHRAIGVERIYVFLDRCRDASAALASRFPWVRPFVVDRTGTELPYVADLQAACMNHAHALARDAGIDWLLVLDPDEFAFADNPGARDATSRAHLPTLLLRVRPETAMVRLATREVVPVRLPSDAPFWKQRYFQTSPALEWRILDPLTGDLHAWNDFLGHRQGKYLVRTSLAVQGYDSHRWVPEQGRRAPDRPQFVPLPTEELGCHWHFFVTDQDHWRGKFRKQAFEPETWPCGSAVELPKVLWRRAASLGTEREVGDYFARWIARPEDELRGLAARGLVVESRAVESVLREAGHLDGDALRWPKRAAARSSPQGFRPADDRGPALEVDAAGRILDYPAALTPAERLRGAHELETFEGRPFRWLEPQAALRLAVPPGAYRLHLHMDRLALLWTGQLALALD